jgi:predicted tellurium resistance membrane protein TerC
MAKTLAGIGGQMAEFFTAEHLLTLVVLTALETVLGFDNLLYITIEAKRVAPERQKYVRQVGIVLAIVLRIVLLFIVLQLIAAFKEPFASLTSLPLTASINGHSIIVLVGGLFLIYTALKEIFHMLVVHNLGHGEGGQKQRTVASAIFWVLIMNIVFSFDTVLSAVALTDYFPVMAIAIIVSGVLMVWLSEHVAAFLRKNRMYEVLGLFVLLLVGVMLTSEGAHLMHLAIFNYTIEPIEKGTFYFVVAALILVDMVQSRYQKKILAEERVAAPLPAEEPSGHA